MNPDQRPQQAIVGRVERSDTRQCGARGGRGMAGIGLMASTRPTESVRQFGIRCTFFGGPRPCLAVSAHFAPTPPPPSPVHPVVLRQAQDEGAARRLAYLNRHWRAMSPPSSCLNRLKYAQTCSVYWLFFAIHPLKLKNCFPYIEYANDDAGSAKGCAPRHLAI